jgi:hypothetical protein
LVCGQIDETFVGSIVKHLAHRPNLDEWSEGAPIQEFLLAVGCLAEVRTLNKLQSVLDELGKRLLPLYIPGYGHFEYYDDLNNLIFETPSPWPGTSHLNSTAVKQMDEIDSEDGWGGEYLPLFLAHVAPDRKTQQRFLDADAYGLRRGAIKALAKKWPDEMTRRLLEVRAIEDNSSGPRKQALIELSTRWPDEKTRALLVLRAKEDKHFDPRRQALRELRAGWPDGATCGLLKSRAEEDSHFLARQHALIELRAGWPDEATRALLASRTREDESEYPRAQALIELRAGWPDEATRALLASRAKEDEHFYPRAQALIELRAGWLDEETRGLFASRAEEEQNEEVRIEALRLLLEHWPGEKSQQLLIDRAAIDGSAAATLGNQYSRFGGLVFSMDCNGRWPYLDPREPLSREHIERAAKKARVPKEEIDETVRSLSEHMGWDITKGSRHG